MEAVQAGQSYKFLIQSGDETFERIDPYAREVTNSVGEGVIVDPQAFDWQGIQFELPPHNALVIYEMHVGSFLSHEGETGKFETALQQLDHLKKLGINAVQTMPVAEVRQFIRDNVMMWLNDFHINGLRFDSTLYMRSSTGDGNTDLPEGWSLMQWLNDEVQWLTGRRIMIAEDLHSLDAITAKVEHGGAGFHAQWDANF